MIIILILKTTNAQTDVKRNKINYQASNKAHLSDSFPRPVFIIKVEEKGGKQ